MTDIKAVAPTEILDVKEIMTAILERVLKPGEVASMDSVSDKKSETDMALWGGQSIQKWTTIEDCIASIECKIKEFETTLQELTVSHNLRWYHIRCNYMGTSGREQRYFGVLCQTDEDGKAIETYIAGRVKTTK
jgi:hypothetical protein